jgi:TP901 family phage tail tape measure protein
MASESELADLFLTLRAVNAPILEAFTRTASAGEEMVAALNTQFAEFDGMIARTAESLAGLRDGMAGVATSTSEMGAGAVTGAATSGAAVAGEATAAGGVGAAAAADAAAAKTASDEEVAAWDRAQAAFAQLSVSVGRNAADISATWAGLATKVEADNAALVTSASNYGRSLGGVTTAVDGAASSWQSKLGTMSSSLTKVGLAGGVLAGATVDMAAKFQSSTTRLVTSGGELASNLQADQQGILALAGQVGYSADDLSSAMYKITSAGQSGAQALNTLKASAQGAKTENADLTTVADAVSTAMIDYKNEGLSAADVTSKLVAATSQGKTNFQDLAGAMSAILPRASTAHISFSEILGDLASMTQHGESAQQSAQNLADAISHMQKPTQAQSKELAALGLNSTQLSQDLGKNGLSGTIGQISDAITQRMGKGANAVILQMQDALKGLPKPVQDLSQQVLNGSASWADWNKATKDLTVTQKSQAGSFATLVNGMHTIGTEQLSGSQVMQTYAGAMQGAMGTSAGLNVALMLTGQNSGNTTKAIGTVSKATADAQGNVQGWTEIQKTFNQKMSEAKDGLGAAAIAVGQKLLPAVTAIVSHIASFTTWLSKNQAVATGLAWVIGVLLAGGVLGLIGKFATFAISMGKNVIAPITKTVKFTKDLVGGFQGAESAAGTFGGKVATVFQGIGKAASATWSGISTAASATWSGISKAASSAWSGISSAASSTWSLIAKGASAAWSGIASAATASWSVITSAASSAWSGISSVVGTVFSAIGSGARALGTILVETVWPALVDAAVATWSFTAALLANPITWIVIAVIALGVAVYELITHWKQVSAFFSKLWADVVGFFKKAWADIKAVVTGVVIAVVTWLVTQWNKMVNDVKKVGTDIANAAKTAWNAVKNAVMDVVNGIVNWVKNMWTTQVNDYKQLGTDIKNVAVTAWNYLKNWVSNLVKNIVTGIKTEWNQFLNFWKTLGTDIGNAAKNAWNDVLNFFQTLPSKIGNFFADAGKWLLNAGKAILSGLLGGLKQAWQDVTNFIGGIGNWISQHKGPIEYDRTLLTPHGNAIMQGLLSGLQQGGQHVQNYLGEFTRGIANTNGGSLGINVGVTGAVSGSALAPMVGGVGGGSGSGVIVIQPGAVVVNVAGSVTAEDNLVRSVQQGILKLSGRNSGFGTTAAFA